MFLSSTSFLRPRFGHDGNIDIFALALSSAGPRKARAPRCPDRGEERPAR